MRIGRKWMNAVWSVLAPVMITFLIGAVIIAAIGEDPVLTYTIMIQKSLFSFNGLMKTLHFASPLILTGLAIAVTFKANIFNMGVEGQAVLGAFFATVVGFSVKGLPQGLHIFLCLLTGVVTGILFALPPALLKAYYRVDEMVVTLMLNYVVVEITKYLAQGVFKDPASGYVSTYAIHDSAMFLKLFDSDITLFFFIAIAVFMAMYVLFRKSKLGYEITAIGLNPDFSEAVGMRVRKKIIILMIISGAISGLAGAGFLMSEKYRYTLDFSGTPGLGWDGMLISLLGGHNPVGIIIAAIFYAALKTGSEYIGLFTNVPKEIVGVIQGILILFLSVRFIGERFRISGRIKALLKWRNQAEKEGGNSSELG